ERFLTLIEAKQCLEARPPRRAGSVSDRNFNRLRRVQGDSVQRTCVKAPFVSPMEDPPPLQAGKRLDFLKQQLPFFLPPTVQLFRGPAEDLRQREHQEGPLLDARRPGGVEVFANLVAQFAQRSAKRACMAGSLGQGETIQKQSHG